MSVLSDIVQWSEDKPVWWQDALRRLFHEGQLGATDIAELALMCRESHGVCDPCQAAPTPKPLKPSHVPITATGDDDVTLTKLSDLYDVNALVHGAGLDFARSGVTVVYGDNASGKSGYVRVLKQVCRARGGPERVHPNVFGEPQAGPPRARIAFAVGGAERVVDWEDGRACDPALTAISVFDASSAHHYVTQEADVAYRPLGLDLLDRLASACLAVREILEQEKAALEAARADLSALEGDTAVGELIASLLAETPSSDVEALAGLSTADQQRLETLRHQLAELRARDPAKRARELRARAARYEVLHRQVSVVAERLSSASIEALQEADRRAQATAEAARAAADTAFAGEPLPGVGSAAWRELWESARRYSEGQPYAGNDFPVTTDGARCVLCQQELDEDARARLARFESFVRGDLEEKASEARATLRRLRRTLEGLVIPDAGAPIIDELADDDPDCAKRLGGLLEAARRTASAVKLALEQHDWTQIPSLSAAPLAELRAAAQAMRTQADTLDSQDSADQQAAIEKEVGELEARVQLDALKSTVLSEIGRLLKVAKLDRCIGECKTQGISRFSTKLTRERITDALRRALERELWALGLSDLRVELASLGSERGVSYHQIRLKGKPNVAVADIASEGEQRCLALAAFLAELATASHRSTIILDDPVSSLDHRWRDGAARRLAREAKSRQVIVFTHDLFFLMLLRQHCDDADVICTECNVARSAEGYGACSEGPPWLGSTVNQRLGWLNVLCQKAEKVLRDEGETPYRTAASHIYGKLRQAWERAVEEVLLHGTVQRFARPIHTKLLRYVVDLTEADCRRVDKGMAKCSRYHAGHDQPAVGNEPVPRPDEVRQDVADLRDFVKQVRERRK